MSSKIYLITVDSTDPSIDLGGLKNVLKAGSPDIENWWHHIPYVFLVSTRLNANSISELIRPFTGHARFLVVEVDPAESEGSLPEQAWRWIRTRSSQDELSGVS